jgi:hypothetical protein
MSYNVAVFPEKPKWDKTFERWSFVNAIVESASPDLFQALGIPIDAADKNLYNESLQMEPIYVELELPIDRDGNCLLLQPSR